MSLMQTITRNRHVMMIDDRGKPGGSLLRKTFSHGEYERTAIHVGQQSALQDRTSC